MSRKHKDLSSTLPPKASIAIRLGLVPVECGPLKVGGTCTPERTLHRMQNPARRARPRGHRAVTSEKRRRKAGRELGYVTARIIECVFILVGLISTISVVTVSNALAGATGATAAALTAQGALLVSTYEWAFLFGPGLVVGFGNGLVLGCLMYRSGLVPRRMAMLGLVGGPMLILSFVLILFGVYENGSGPAFLLAVPEIAWEGSLGIYAAWKGFRPSPITKGVDVRRDAPGMAIA